MRIYDPIFTSADRQGLADLHFTVDSEDKVRMDPFTLQSSPLNFVPFSIPSPGDPQNGEYDLSSSPVFVYMPHCDIELHERLLRYNFSFERLSNVLMIANDLAVYAERSALCYLQYLKFHTQVTFFRDRCSLIEPFWANSPFLL